MWFTIHPKISIAFHAAKMTVTTTVAINSRILAWDLGNMEGIIQRVRDVESVRGNELAPPVKSVSP
jgi:hypothetical protein